MKVLPFFVFITLSFAQLQAGVSYADATSPIGTLILGFLSDLPGAPLAGFNHGARRAPFWPIPRPDKYTTFMMPSVGVLDPNFAKALVLDDGKTSVAIVTLDGIGSDGTLNLLAYDIAKGRGFTVPFENVLFSSSHSHSGIPEF